MRILVTAFPGLGHLHPLVPLALAAQTAGHDVRLGIGADLVGWARRCGLDAWPVGLTVAAAHLVVAREHRGPDRANHLFTDVCVPAALPELLDLASTWRPELVLHEEAEYAGVLLAAILDIGCVTQSWSSPARPAASREAQTRLLAPVWDRYLPGAPPRREGRLYLDACPAPFQTDDIAGIARTTRVEAVGPALFDGPPAPAPDWLADLPRPAAYLTLGTVDVFSTPAMLAHAASALSLGFASVVVSTGPNPVSSLGLLPPHVRAVQYLPQSLVLPSVDVVVSHGGAGGSVAALAHGLPHLVLAGTGDSQRTTAAAVQRIGAGLALATEERPAARIAEAAARLVDEPAFAAAARRAGDELARRPGPSATLALLESHLAG